VKIDRTFISKDETGQLDQDVGWFNIEYPGCVVKPIFIHPSKVLNEDAFPNSTSYSISPDKLELLKKNVKDFYGMMAKIPTDSLNKEIISKKMSETNLDRLSMHRDYYETINRS